MNEFRITREKTSSKRKDTKTKNHEKGKPQEIMKTNKANIE